MDSIQIIILAAGHGKRMNSDLPKVLLPVNNTPMIKHLLTSIEQSQISRLPVIVVGQKAEKVKQVLGEKYNYILQKQQLGTGHAVMTAKKCLKSNAKHIMVLYGDHPLVSNSTINKIGGTHIENDATLTMATTEIENFDGWRTIFFEYGRIIRNKNNEIEKIVEKKDATSEEKLVREVNPAYFCFKSDWLWNNLDHLNNNNAQKEYYLTALPSIARKNNAKISTVAINPKEALGANTLEQLKFLEEVAGS